MGELWFVDEDGNRGTVSVSRKDVDAVLTYAASGPPRAASYPAQRVRQALPSKPWEPSDEMIEATRSVWSGLGPDRATDLLKDQHEAGVFAAWDRMQEADR